MNKLIKVLILAAMGAGIVLYGMIATDNLATESMKTLGIDSSN